MTTAWTVSIPPAVAEEIAEKFAEPGDTTIQALNRLFALLAKGGNRFYGVAPDVPVVFPCRDYDGGPLMRYEAILVKEVTAEAAAEMAA
jgi:hypothetical protein